MRNSIPHLIFRIGIDSLSLGIVHSCTCGNGQSLVDRWYQTSFLGMKILQTILSFNNSLISLFYPISVACSCLSSLSLSLLSCLYSLSSFSTFPPKPTSSLFPFFSMLPSPTKEQMSNLEIEKRACTTMVLSLVLPSQCFQHTSISFSFHLQCFFSIFEDSFLTFLLFSILFDNIVSIKICG